MKKVINEVVLSSPLDNTSVNSKFGPRWGRNHNGVDLAANAANVKSPLDGVVEVGEIRNDSCGGTIIITHPDGFKTGYCHMQKINVRQGQKVRKGDIIGVSGGGANDPGRGRSDGRHLHFSLKKDGKFVDPMQYIDKVNVSSSDISLSGATPSDDSGKTNWDDFFSGKFSNRNIKDISQRDKDPILQGILEPLKNATILQFEHRDFITPINEDYELSNGRYISSLEYTISQGKKVLNPDIGKVVDISDKNNCKNSITVQHAIDKKTYYTEFCSVENIKVRAGQNIPKNKVLGIAGQNTIVRILDRSKTIMSFKQFEDESKEKDPNKPKDKPSLDSRKDPILDLLTNPLRSLDFDSKNTKTVSMNDKVKSYGWVDWLSKNTVSKNESIQENISRFKSLMGIIT